MGAKLEILRPLRPVRFESIECDCSAACELVTHIDEFLSPLRGLGLSCGILSRRLHAWLHSVALRAQISAAPDWDFISWRCALTCKCMRFARPSWDR